MTELFTLETPEELLHIKRESILREIESHDKQERNSFQQFMHGRVTRKELETLLAEFDNAIELLER